jgi:hypothetical protein
MPIALCSWCGRSRVVQRRAWVSRRTGQTMAGDVCEHCWSGTDLDDCRTCRRRAENAPQVAPVGGEVHEITRSDVAAMLEMQGATTKKRRRA